MTLLVEKPWFTEIRNDLRNYQRDPLFGTTLIIKTVTYSPSYSVLVYFLLRSSQLLAAGNLVTNRPHNMKSGKISLSFLHFTLSHFSHLLFSLLGSRSQGAPTKGMSLLDIQQQEQENAKKSQKEKPSNQSYQAKVTAEFLKKNYFSLVLCFIDAEEIFKWYSYSADQFAGCLTA